MGGAKNAETRYAGVVQYLRISAGEIAAPEGDRPRRLHASSSEFKIHNHERDGRVAGDNYVADGGDTYDLG